MYMLGEDGERMLYHVRALLLGKFSKLPLLYIYQKSPKNEARTISKSQLYCGVDPMSHHSSTWILRKSNKSRVTPC